MEEDYVVMGGAVFIIEKGKIRAGVCVGFRNMITGEDTIYVSSQYGDLEYPEEFSADDIGKTIFYNYKDAKEALSNGNTVRDK